MAKHLRGEQAAGTAGGRTSSPGRDTGEQGPEDREGAGGPSLKASGSGRLWLGDHRERRTERRRGGRLRTS